MQKIIGCWVLFLSLCSLAQNRVDLFTFDQFDEGFTRSVFQKPFPGPHVESRVEDIPVSSLPPAARRAHAGEGGVLVVSGTMRSDTTQTMRPFTVIPGANWSGADSIGYSVWVPPHMQPHCSTWIQMETGLDWRRWESPRRVELVPGTWNKLRISVQDTIETFNLAQVGKFAIFLKGRSTENTEVSFYIDSVIAYCQSSLYPLPDYSLWHPTDTIANTVHIDAATYGGTVSEDLFSFNHSLLGTDNNAFYQQALRQAGPGIIRMWNFAVDWNPAPGVYDFSEWEAALEYALDAGWSAMITLGRVPHWNAYEYKPGEVIAKGPGAEENITHRLNGPPLDYEAFAESYAALITHLNSVKNYGVRYVEIWNEPDLPFWGGTQAEYNKLVAVTARALRQADSSIKICAGVYSSPQALEQRLEQLLQTVDTKDIDYISHHRYFNASPRMSSAELVSLLPTFEHGPHLTRSILQKVQKQTGKPTGHIGVIMSESSVNPSLEYMPRIETSWYAVFWAAGLHHLIRHNVEVATYFTFNGYLWGTMHRKRRPVYWVFELLNSKASIGGGRWLRSSWASADIRVSAVRKKLNENQEQFSLLLINTNTESKAIQNTIVLRDKKLPDTLLAYTIADTGYAPPRVDTVIAHSDSSFSITVGPMRVCVVHTIAKADPQGYRAMQLFTPEVSAGAQGLALSGQYSFDKNPFIFSSAPETVTIDAELSEFTNAPHYFINQKHQVIEGIDHWDGPQDASASVQAMWDSSYLYLGVRVTDDRAIKNSSNDIADAWKADAIEIYVSTHKIYAGRSTKSAYDYQLIATQLSDGSNPGVVYSYDGPGKGIRNSVVPGAQVALLPNESGYTAEIKIPARAFYDVTAFSAGQNLRIDIGLCDSDSPAGPPRRQSHLLWNSQRNSWDSPDEWGLAQLQ